LICSRYAALTSARVAPACIRRILNGSIPPLLFMTHRPLLEVLRGRRRAPLLFRYGTSSTRRQAVGWRSGGDVGAVPGDGGGGAPRHRIVLACRGQRARERLRIGFGLPRKARESLFCLPLQGFHPPRAQQEARPRGLLAG